MKNLPNGNILSFMQHADIEWENDQAVSKQFGDIFFSRLGGLEESNHIFLGLNQLQARFNCSETFQIGELGFGTGLNFILCWQLWLKLAPKSSRLHFVSTELFPMKAEDIRHAHKLWPEIFDLSEELIASLPLAIEGAHRISFADGRVNLTLLYGDAKKTLNLLEVCENKFDCWFLDGFSPQKNPKMWEATLLETITDLSKPSSTFATYSVAGFLRRSMEQLGWKLEKVPGFAHKREALKGELIQKTCEDTLEKSPPWFSLKNLEYKKSNSAVVIGGGLAGCWSAYCLAKRGYKVSIIEREARIASKASGNIAGLAIPYLSLEKNARQRFYLSAFDFCRREFDSLERSNHKFGKKRSGALHFLPLERIKTFAARFDELSIPPDLAFHKSDTELFYPSASSLSPRQLCHALLAAFPLQIEVILNSEALILEYQSPTWCIQDTENRTIASSEIVVIANSYDALTFSQTSWIPLTKVRGEIVIVKDPSPKLRPQHSLCGKSYLIPLSENEFLIGASYNQVFLDPEPSEQIQKNLLENSQKEFGVFSDKAQIESSRVGFRASTYDRMPYVGPVPEFSKSLQDYSEYKKGFRLEKFSECSYLPGLFVNLGHGSRGVVSAPLCAELLASVIAGEALPLEKDLLPALLPMRWIIRELARGHEVVRQRKAEAEFD